MKFFLKTVLSESVQILTSKLCWIISILLLLVQPLLAYITSQTILETGLNATPETNPELAQAIPPVDYLGFDVVLMGLPLVVLLGVLVGVGNYRNHQLRTLFLAQSNRKHVFFSKILSLLLVSSILSFLALFLTIFSTHIGLGNEGLNPIGLSSIAWKYIFYATFYWASLTILSFGLGILFKSSIFPLLFLFPQIYNLGNYLAERWEWGNFFPIAAGNRLLVSPTDVLTQDIGKSFLVLIAWSVIMLVIAFNRFLKRDVGGKY